jgi:O-antigen/teichoic acid export membrane protein
MYFIKSEFTKNVFTLMTGTTLAQFLPVAISPILTRLYTSDDFGLFAIYTSIVLILTSLSTGRYEQAVILPKGDDDAIHIVFLIFLIALIIGFIALIVVLISEDFIVKALKNTRIAVWLYILPISILLNGSNLGLTYWLVRKKYYKRLATSRVMQSIATVATNLAMGLVDVRGGLILGFLAGQSMAVIILGSKLWGDIRNRSDVISMREIKGQFQRYVNFPRFSVISSFIESTASQLHIILISVFFGSSLVGYLALTQRVIRFPVTLVATSVADVFRQRASEYFANEGRCNEFFVKTAKNLFTISIVPFLVLTPFAPALFEFLFGSEWRIAGEYAQIMALMFFLQFTVSPLSSMFMIAEKQKYDLLMQIFLITTTFISLSAGYYIFNDGKIAVALFVLAYSIKYCMEFGLSYGFSKGEVRG